MTDLQFALLRRIRSDESPTVVSMLNTMDADPVAVSSELSTLTDQGMVEKSAVSDSYCILSLTYKGVSALLSETEKRSAEALCAQQIADQHAKGEKQQRFDRKIAIAGLLVSLVSLILGIFSEHLFDIINLLRTLFHS